MKILIINGSPKREKSDTMHITRAFTDGMKDVCPNDVRIINAADARVEYCTGCFSCMHNGGKCIHDDDMRQILNAILVCDLLIFSFPLYCYAMPAQLKTIVDRMLPLTSMAMRKEGERYRHVSQANTAHIRYAMICGCGFPNSRGNFEAVLAQFSLMFPQDSLKLTVPEAPMFSAPEAAIVTEPYLALVRQAGREYAQCGAVSGETMAKLNVPMLDEDVYAKICSGDMQP